MIGTDLPFCLKGEDRFGFTPSMNLGFDSSVMIHRHVEDFLPALVMLIRWIAVHLNILHKRLVNESSPAWDDHLITRFPSLSNA